MDKLAVPAFLSVIVSLFFLGALVFTTGRLSTFIKEFLLYGFFVKIAKNSDEETIAQLNEKADSVAIHAVYLAMGILATLYFGAILARLPRFFFPLP